MSEAKRVGLVFEVSSDANINAVAEVLENLGLGPKIKQDSGNASRSYLKDIVVLNEIRPEAGKDTGATILTAGLFGISYEMSKDQATQMLFDATRLALGVKGIGRVLGVIFD